MEGGVGDLLASIEDQMLPAVLSQEVRDELATLFRDRNRKQNVMGSGRTAMALVMKPDYSSFWEEDSTLSADFLTLCYALHLPAQVICGSKYLVRGESARDHVDLLVSSRHWPPVYVVDMATPVALCADLCYPELTNQMWGRNQGCFSSPAEPPVVSSLLRS